VNWHRRLRHRPQARPPPLISRLYRLFASWHAENRWFGADRARTEFALLYAKDLHLEQPDLAGRPFLNALSARVKEIFASSKR